MNPTDSCLQRLLRAAARAPEEFPSEAPFYLEARVLAAWHRPPADEPAIFALPVVRAAFFCACAIILVSAAITFQSLHESSPNELVIVDSVIQLTLTQ
jgi:hypothetical protein